MEIPISKIRFVAAKKLFQRLNYSCIPLSKKPIGAEHKNQNHQYIW